LNNTVAIIIYCKYITTILRNITQESQQKYDTHNFAMSRGDQRDRDRQKRQAKEAAKNKGSAREGTPSQRNADDAAKLQAKLAAKAAKKSEEENGNSGTVPVLTRPKVAKKTDTLDDLLSAGLGKKTRK
jgi:hypothetical protein